MRRAAIAVAVGLSLLLAGCAGAGSAPSSSSAGATEAQPISQESVAASAQQSDAASAAHEGNEGEVAEMRMSIDETDVSVAWENNRTVADLEELAVGDPIVVELHMYGGFEQVGPLGTSLAADDVQMTTEPGDIVLYAGDQISIFYGPNTWAYTKLGHITDKTPDELAELLGNGDVSITISVG